MSRKHGETLHDIADLLRDIANMYDPNSQTLFILDDNARKQALLEMAQEISEIAFDLAPGPYA